MTTRFPIIILLTVALRVNAQIPVSEFLRSAENDPEVNTFREQSAYLQTKPFQLSPLQRLEFRTQNRELIPHQQEFGLRITPANPWEVKHNNTYFKSYQAAIDLRNEMALKDALTERYVAVIQYVYFREAAALTRYSRELLNDQLSILEKQSGSNFFDADDYVDLQLDLMERTVELEESEFSVIARMHEVEKLYRKSAGDSLAWKLGDLIDMERVAVVMDSLTAVDIISVTQAYQRQKIQLALDEYKLEKANINAGFLQAEFDNRRQEQGRTPFNVSLGITIPIVNPNKGDMTKRQMDVIEARNDLQESVLEEKETTISSQDKAQRLLLRYRMVKEKLKSYESGSLAGMLTAIEGGDPRIVVKFNENLVKLKLLLLRIRRDALLAYVDYLASADKIQQRPMINYLSPTLEEIE
jgi:hypothetical protein